MLPRFPSGPLAARPLNLLYFSVTMFRNSSIRVGLAGDGLSRRAAGHRRLHGYRRRAEEQRRCAEHK